MTIFLPRSAWTSTARGGAASVPGRVLGIASHWPGSTTDRYGVEAQAAVAARLRGWRDYHVNGRGWSDIGYTVAGDQAGRVWDLRGTSRVGAHCASASNEDANWEWHGFLWVLGDKEEPSEALVQAFWDWRRMLVLPKFPEATRLLGHREVPGAQTSCPGDEVIEEIHIVSFPVRPRPVQTPPQPSEDEMGFTPEQATELLANIRRQTELQTALVSEVGGSQKDDQNMQTLTRQVRDAIGSLNTTVTRLAAAIEAQQ